MDRYTARMNAHGTTQRDRYVSRVIRDINNKVAANPSYKLTTKLNGEDVNLVIDDGTSNNNKKVTALPGQVLKLGDYVDWDNKKYLITSLDPDDEIYLTGTMVLCTTLLRWQKPNGVIVERWAYAEDFTKYDSGEKSNGVITIPSNQYGMTVPIDAETKIISRRTRFVIDVIDGNDYENGAIPDVYRVSNRKTALNNDMYFDRGGVMTLTLTFDGFNAQTDHYIDLGNGQYGWICGLAEDSDINKPDPVTNIIYSISGEDAIYPPYADKWTAVFTDADNKPVEFHNWEFKVVADFDVKWDWQEDSVTISVDKKYIGKKFTLQVLEINSGKVLTEKKIAVMGLG